MDQPNPATNTPHQIPQVQIGVGTPPNVVQTSTVPEAIASNLVVNTSMPTGVPPANPPPVHSEPHPHTHWKLIAFIFFIAFLGLAAFTFYLWNQNKVLVNEQQSILFPTPTTVPSPLATTPLCPEGFKYLDTEVYSLCYPQDMIATNTTNPVSDDPNVARVSSTIENETHRISLNSSFIGGWGGGMCESQKITIDGIPAEKVSWDSDSESPCSTEITSIVVVIGQGEQGKNYPIAVSYMPKDTGFVNPATFSTVLNTIKIKK